MHSIHHTKIFKYEKEGITSALSFTGKFSFTQLNIFCHFERLFTVKPGMDKLAVIDTLQKNSKITLLKMEADKLKPYSGTCADSIIHEIAIYRIDSSACLKGRNNTIKFEFADNKLHKAYLVTDYCLMNYLN